LKKGGTIKVTVPERILDIVNSTVEMGLFSSPSDLGKTAIIAYLDNMHLLDEVKSNIGSKPLD